MLWNEVWWISGEVWLSRMALSPKLQFQFGGKKMTGKGENECIFPKVVYMVTIQVKVGLGWLSRKLWGKNCGKNNALTDNNCLHNNITNQFLLKVGAQQWGVHPFILIGWKERSTPSHFSTRSPVHTIGGKPCMLIWKKNTHITLSSNGKNMWKHYLKCTSSWENPISLGGVPWHECAFPTRGLINLQLTHLIYCPTHFLWNDVFKTTQMFAKYN